MSDKAALQMGIAGSGTCVGKHLPSVFEEDFVSWQLNSMGAVL